MTAASALVLIAMAVLFAWLHVDESRLAGIEDPERALALIVSRTMDLQLALAGAAAWERRLYALTLSDAASEFDQAIEWYEELAAESLAPDVDLRLAILLGEDERRERLERVLRQWRVRGDPLASYGQAIAAAYLGGGEVDTEGASAALDELGAGWFADVLALRLAARLDDPVAVETARAAIAARAQPLLWRLRALAALELGLVVLGIVAALGWMHRAAGAARAVADAPLPPPWSLGAGLTALVRGGALAALMVLILLLGAPWLAEQPLLGEALDQPLLYLPLLWLVRRTLLGPARLGVVEAFGLRPRPGGWRPCIRATLVLVAAGIALDLGLALFGESLGLTTHWTEWFDAALAWGSAAAVGVTLLGSVVFAPVFEELIFRGLLHGTLRARLAWPLAALGSALVFGLAHGYGVIGFLSVFLSGLLWAWGYERTGSLLPALLAHVINNATVVLALTALLR